MTQKSQGRREESQISQFRFCWLDGIYTLLSPLNQQHCIFIFSLALALLNASASVSLFGDGEVTGGDVFLFV